MACTCGGTAISTQNATQIVPPDPTSPKAPDGTVLGQDISHGGTVPAYRSPGGAGTASSGGGYTANGSQHSTGASYVPKTPLHVAPGLGGLSAQYESGGKGPGAIGGDPVGGMSYGTYQIATKPGTMNNFMNYLQTNNPTQFAKLQAAGGINGAIQGTPTFQQAWQDLAANDSTFAQSQHDFIQSTHFDPAVAKIQSATGIDVTQRSLGVQNAVWSTAVQHGPNSDVFTNAFASRDPSKMSDEDIINALYDERSKTDGNGTMVYFHSSPPNIQASVANRFTTERQGALNQIGTPPVITPPVITNKQTGI